MKKCSPEDDLPEEALATQISATSEPLSHTLHSPLGKEWEKLAEKFSSRERIIGFFTSLTYGLLFLYDLKALAPDQQRNIGNLTLTDKIRATIAGVLIIQRLLTSAAFSRQVHDIRTEIAYRLNLSQRNTSDLPSDIALLLAKEAAVLYGILFAYAYHVSLDSTHSIIGFAAIAAEAVMMNYRFRCRSKLRTLAYGVLEKPDH